MTPDSYEGALGRSQVPDPIGLSAPLSSESGLCGGPGQISCDEANELIQQVLDKVGDPTVDQLLNEHVGDCPPCEHEFVVYQRIVASLVRSRPTMPGETAARIERFCADLCDGKNSL